MIQTLRLLNILIFVTTIVFSYTPYVIYTSNSFSDAANLMKEIHTEMIPEKYGYEPLDVIIKYKEDYDIQSLIEYLNQFQDCYGLDESSCNGASSCDWIDYSFNTNNLDFCFNPKYLMIIGDENIIPSISTGCGEWPLYSDDLFNINFSTGRLIVSNNIEAINQINKLVDYIENENENNWKSKLLLIADNEFTNNPNSFETTHTEYTSRIYDIMKNESIVNTIYATEFDISPSYTQPDLTETIINSINSGVGIVNYIGHGTNQALAHELILKLDRDINLFSTDNRPPIWIVGTCGFGEYINTTCMAEELLKKEDAAIAILSTTVGISEQDNSEYLFNFYNSISDYINNKNEFRLGDIFRFSKKSFENTGLNNDYCIARRFQLFGDPALPMMLTKKANNSIFNRPNEILIGSSNSLIINQPYSGTSYIKILDNDIVNELGNITYNKQGTTLFESSFNNSIEYFLPIDMISNDVKIIVSSNDSIQVESNINTTLDVDLNILDDNEGPTINLYYNNIEISNNTFISQPYNFLIEFSDFLPINLSGYNSHNLRFWIDDNQDDGIILNNLYIPISNTSGFVSLIFDNNKFKDNSQYKLNIEAWDILNNHTVKSLLINTKSTPKEIFNVFNFPNPFDNLTYFTFHMKNPEPILIEINLFSKNGKIIKQFSDTINSSKAYHVFPDYGWDGKDKFGSNLMNGTYFYNLKISSINGTLLHNGLHNITILK